MNANKIIEILQLMPHPEGGWYRETWKSNETNLGRASGTSIYFLLKAGEISRWHKIDSVEIWHFYLGAPLKLKTINKEDGLITERILGTDLTNSQSPQLLVGKDLWQSAETIGNFTLVGCTVSPGFEFSKFVLAPEEFNPKN